MLGEHKYRRYNGENGSLGARYSAGTTEYSSDKVWDGSNKVKGDIRDV